MYLILDVYAAPNLRSSQMITLETVWYDYTEEAITIDSPSESYCSPASESEYETFVSTLREEMLGHPTIADIRNLRSFVSYPDIDDVDGVDDCAIPELKTFRSLLSFIR